MHPLTLLALSGTLSLTSAQAINLAAVLDTPLPPLSIDLLAPPPPITYSPSAATSSIAAAALAANTPPAIARRHLESRNATCSPLPSGAGPVPSPDTSTAFFSSTALSSAAKDAKAPANYTAAYTDLHAATSAPAYLGVSELTSYNTTECASMCDAKAGCTAINIYFQRTPTRSLGADCQDPPSSTLIQCVFWGEAVTRANAVNTGYTEQAFVVAIAGSNGYNKGEAVKVAAGEKSWGVRTAVSGVVVVGWAALVAGIVVGV